MEKTHSRTNVLRNKPTERRKTYLLKEKGSNWKISLKKVLVFLKFRNVTMLYKKKSAHF